MESKSNMRIIFLALISFFLLGADISATVMNSTNYSLESDSLNFGGGRSSSSNFVQESTFGEIATGYLASANYNLHAGYQQMDASFLSLSVSGNVSLLPAIPASGAGVATGSTTVLVTTDNSAGYELYIKASSSPALVSNLDSFGDYTPVGVGPDFLFVVLASDGEFGFSPEGADIVQSFKDDGATCNAGSSNTVDRCWLGLLVSNILVASDSSANSPGGEITTLKFRAESGVSNTQIPGSYVATSTVTAIAL